MSSQSKNMIHDERYPEKIIDVDTSRSFRCPMAGCDRLLFKGTIDAVEIKCPSCKNMVNIGTLG